MKKLWFTFDPSKLVLDVMLLIGLWFMPGIWWAKVLVFLGIASTSIRRRKL